MDDRPKLVISGSASLQDRLEFWKNHFEQKGYKVIGMPEIWSDTRDFKEQLTELYRDFYTSIEDCDVFFLMNEDKDGISGYIGANGTAELVYAVMLNLIKDRGIEIYITKTPEKRVLAWDEVVSYLRVGWVKVYEP